MTLLTVLPRLRTNNLKGLGATLTVVSAKRPVVANIGPDPAGDGLQFRQHRHRRIVSVDAFRAHDMGLASIIGSSATTQAPIRSARRSKIDSSQTKSGVRDVCQSLPVSRR